ncbi:MAG TPA: Uma2 family endonuclease [Phototrophicaceae bacterium]|nr:Uma2 family endonuclease [Phototrophicaceae bacterium]
MTVGEFTYTPSGQIIAMGVSEEEYLDKYAEHFCEWVNGTVIKMAPATDRHDETIRYGARLLEAYFELKPIGELRHLPFLMRLPTGVNREPDLLVVLNNNLSILAKTSVNGAADICIEIVSPESIKRDRGEKFEEYEKGGVGEYWIWDILRAEALFYARNEEGIFVPQDLDAAGNYRTSLLPGLVINVPTLWRKKLPGPIAVGRSVEAMLESSG